MGCTVGAVPGLGSLPRWLGGPALQDIEQSHCLAPRNNIVRPRLNPICPPSQTAMGGCCEPRPAATWAHERIAADRMLHAQV